MVKRRKNQRLRKPEDWAAMSKGLLEAELVNRDISYQQLADQLAKIGVHETPVNLTNKVNRGKFSATFLIQSLEAIECKLFRIGDE